MVLYTISKATGVPRIIEGCLCTRSDGRVSLETIENGNLAYAIRDADEIWEDRAEAEFALKIELMEFASLLNELVSEGKAGLETEVNLV